MDHSAVGEEADMKAPPRDKALPGETHKVTVGCGTLYVTVNSKDGKVLEVIIQGGKSGGCTFATNEGLARCISLGLRAGVDLQEYVKGLSGIKCNNVTYDEGVLMNSCPDAVGQVLSKYLEASDDGTNVDNGDNQPVLNTGEPVHIMDSDKAAHRDIQAV